MPLGDNHGRPHAIFGDSATHFAVRRFKSTEAERESDAEYINQDGGDQVLLFFYVGFRLETLYMHWKYHTRFVKIIHFFFSKIFSYLDWFKE